MARQTKLLNREKVLTNPLSPVTWELFFVLMGFLFCTDVVLHKLHGIVRT